MNSHILKIFDVTNNVSHMLRTALNGRQLLAFEVENWLVVQSLCYFVKGKRKQQVKNR